MNETAERKQLSEIAKVLNWNGPYQASLAKRAAAIIAERDGLKEERARLAAKIERLEAERAEMLEALREARRELAALCPDLENPDFSIATPNPADTDCVHRAYLALTRATAVR